jgi:hypothetical protein
MDSKRKYWMERRDYMPGTGCDQAAVLTVTQNGILYKMNDMTAVKNAPPSDLRQHPSPSPRPPPILPAGSPQRARAASSALRVWPRRSQLHATACDDTSWLRQPIGVEAYGSMRKIGTALRMTSFNADVRLRAHDS